jgi:hypothetical protein
MNTGQIKLWAWTAAGLTTLGLCAYVLDFVRHLDEKSPSPDPADARSMLESVRLPAAKNDDILSYDLARRVVALLDWTGAPKVVPPPPDREHPTPEPLAVERLVIVLGVKQDLADPANSQVALKYRPEARVIDRAIAGFSLRAEGDRLAPPNEGVKIASITAERIVFTFDDVERPPEEIRPAEFDCKSTIVIVGPDGVVQAPSSAKAASNADARRSGRTIQLGANRFRLGADDVEELAVRYAEILGDVGTARHRDPRTGRYDGIEIKSVAPGSIAARHGARTGDVIKSINGHAVTSNQEAIHFIKVSSGACTTWEIVIENHGKTRTITFESSS